MPEDIGEMIKAGAYDEFQRLFCVLGKHALASLLDHFEETGNPVNIEHNDGPIFLLSIQEEGLAFQIGNGTPVSMSLEEARQQGSAQ